MLEDLSPLKEVLDHPDHGQASMQKLLQLHQGSCSVTDYSIEFPILTVDSGWNESVLV